MAFDGTIHNKGEGLGTFCRAVDIVEDPFLHCFDRQSWISLGCHKDGRNADAHFIKLLEASSIPLHQEGSGLREGGRIFQPVAFLNTPHRKKPPQHDKGHLIALKESSIIFKKLESCSATKIRIFLSNPYSPLKFLTPILKPHKPKAFTLHPIWCRALF